MSTIDSDVRESDVRGEHDASDHGRVEAKDCMELEQIVAERNGNMNQVRFPYVQHRWYMDVEHIDIEEVLRRERSVLCWTALLAF